jgi:regulator of protease activity HflC (stomatin/prohibitin superfamily)
MRRAEQIAWGAVGGLVTIGVLLFVGALVYHVTAFWAGMMLVWGQAVVMGLAAWGMGLARQAAELRSMPAVSGYRAGESSTAAQSGGGFRMSVVDEIARKDETKPDQTHILDTGFQRLLVGVSGFVMMALAGVATWVVYVIYSWSLKNPSGPIPIVGTLDEAQQLLAKNETLPVMDERCLLIGVASAAIYGVLYWLTRPTPYGGEEEEAANGNFMMGIAGMAALGVGTALAYFRVTWASEIATLIIAAFMLLQGLEFLVNSFRSFSGIAELENEVVDLQKTPITPMLESVWLGGLRVLFTQSLGLSRDKQEKGVMGRIMPRALLALLVLAIGISCIRVVPPGKVAVLERLGYTPLDADGRRPQESAILHAGMHLTFPWPIDELVYIPTDQLQLVDVGTELHATGDWKKVDFQFWTIRPRGADQNETDDLFITGDPGSPQFLETYVQVQWRVADAARFYAAMSHSEFHEKDEKANSETKILPGYQAMVQQCTSFAVTRTFAIHTLEQVLITQRAEAEEHCKKILQEKLDALCALPGEKAGRETRGIEVAYVTIKDLHPPYWKPDMPATSGTPIGGAIALTKEGKFEMISTPERPAYWTRGPASAFELVVSMREIKEQLINFGQREAIRLKNEAHGEALKTVAEANAYASEKVAQAHGTADRMIETTAGMRPEQMPLLKRWVFFEQFKGSFDPVQKVVVDPETRVQIYQNSEKGAGMPVVPAGR